MAVSVSELRALTIRQPWADLILRGQKTIEVREWDVKHRGPFLIHVGNTIDWKAAEVLGYEDVTELPRRGIIAYAEIVGVFQFDRTSWLEKLREHWVVHPLPSPSYGAVLTNVKCFAKPIGCGGRPKFFLPPESLHYRLGLQLSHHGIEVAPKTA